MSALGRKKAESSRRSQGLRETSNSPTNTYRAALAMRWITCHLLLNYVVGEKVSFTGLGKLLAEKQPWRKTGYDQAIMFRMESGERAIHVEDVIAFVAVLADYGVTVDPGWLAFGDLSGAAPPDADLLLRARLTNI